MPTDEKPEATGPLGVPHIEDVTAPIVYADHCLGGGVSGAGDNVVLTFAVKALDHRSATPAALTKTVLRLVMPRASVANTAEFIASFLGSLEAGAESAAKNTTIN